MERKKLTSTESQSIYGAYVKTDIEYKSGFENRIAEFEIFRDLPINTGFSWGRESGSMSYKWKSKEEPAERVHARIDVFTKSLGITYPRVIHTRGFFEGSQEQFQRVAAKDLGNEDETMIDANFVYTSDTNVGIIIRPGDCPISVVYAKTRGGESIAGLIHSSGVATNAGIPRLAIRHLLDREEIDPASVRIGITPGISRKYFSMSEENTIEKSTVSIIERNWKEHIDLRRTDLDTQRRYVDISGATIMQFQEEGILPSQIEAYLVDTYEAHINGESFSHRLYDENKDLVKPGRYMVAVQLKKAR